MQFAQRLELIPPYLFAKINQRREELIAQGVDIINLGVGDPDQPTPAHILAAMQEAIADPRNHNYPPYLGMAEFRQAIANWMTKRFQITDLDPDQEILVSLGSKEAIHNTFLAFVDPGDYTLIPDPGYPVYRTATIFAGGQSYPMPLLPANNFLPVLTDIPEEIAKKAKLLWVNYPNNPTGAIAHLDFWQELVDFCRKYDILLCHDHAYSEMAYDGYKPPSVLQIAGAKDIAVEFHSLSKSYNMTGWRIGFVVGNAQAIKGLGQVKTNVDSGVFKAIQRAGMAAFATSPEQLQSLMNVYQKRRDVIIQGLQSLGWPIKPPQGSLYVWVPVPVGYSSVDFVNLLIDKCGIIVPPGNGYGTYGEGFFRIALTIPEAQMLEAINRMKKANISYQ
jgi:LL-diaminopimelate aminotransferase